jgi:hypothetical protein
MIASPDEQEPTPNDPDGPASEVEAVAEQLIGLVEEFEAAFSEGRVPPEFGERLTQLRETAERLI